MAEPSLHQSLRQGLKLTPALMQSLELLQMDQLEIEAFINAQMEENPVLDRLENTETRRELEQLRREYLWMRPRVVRTAAGIQEEDAEFPDPFYRAAGIDQTETLEFFLRDQLERSAAQLQVRKICAHLIRMLDQRGYLLEDDLEELRIRSGLSTGLLSEAIALLQSLDPPGIGARTLPECMLLQLERMGEGFEPEKRMVSSCFGVLGRRQYRQVAKRIGCSVRRVEEAMKVIASLNPAPAAGFSEGEPVHYVTPDVFVVVTGEQYEIVFNDSYQPEIGINPYYLNLMEQAPDRETREYLRERIRRAYELQENLLLRKNTFRECVRWIVETQHDFFMTGEHTLLPMTQHTIAGRLGVHDSTISRAIRGKYLQTAFGIFPLKFFFSRAVGEEGASVMHVKELIRRMIAEEDHAAPLSDRQIAEQLAVQGIALPRRTAAKYRVELNLPGAVERKREYVEKGL